jgi:hypothetical protein
MLPQCCNLVVAITGLLLACPSPAAAQDSRRCDVGGSVGRSTATGRFVGVGQTLPVAIASEIEPVGQNYGFWLGCTVAPIVGWDFVWPFHTNHVYGTLIDRAGVLTEHDTYPQIFFLGRALVYPYQGRVAPYFAIGGGILPNMDFSRVGPTLTLGGGVRVYPGERVVLRVEINRYIVTFKDKILGGSQFIDPLVEAFYDMPVRLTDVNFGVGWRF